MWKFCSELETGGMKYLQLLLGDSWKNQQGVPPSTDRKCWVAGFTVLSFREECELSGRVGSGAVLGQSHVC